jgi:hypothetical protein
MRSAEKDGSGLTMNWSLTLDQTMSSKPRNRTTRGVRICCSIGGYKSVWFVERLGDFYLPPFFLEGVLSGIILFFTYNVDILGFNNQTY